MAGERMAAEMAEQPDRLAALVARWDGAVAQVRALALDRSKLKATAGVEPVQGDMTDVVSMRAALEHFVVGVGADERVLRKVAAELPDLLLRDVPRVDGAEDRDENLHFVFFTRRMSPMTIALSTALTMS